MSETPLILVEGADDKHFLWHFLDTNKLTFPFDHIINCKGIERLKENFGVRLELGNLPGLGIIIDADSNVEAQWQSIRNIMIEKGYPNTPKSPNPKGTIVKHPNPENNIEIINIVGVWIMPNNQIPGILEDFIQFMVPDKNEQLSYAKQCVANIPGKKQFGENNISKAEIHTWLAWQEEPGTPLGQAVTKRYLDSDRTHTLPLLEWVRQLFVEELSPA